MGLKTYIRKKILKFLNWLSCKTSILSGIKVGHGAIVGAGAVVTKDVPPYAIVAGVPAKVLRYRFDKEIIEKLLELKWWDFEKEFLAQHIELFKQDLTIELIDDLSCKYNEYKAKTIVAVERVSLLNDIKLCLNCNRGTLCIN